MVGVTFWCAFVLAVCVAQMSVVGLVLGSHDMGWWEIPIAITLAGTAIIALLVMAICVLVWHHKLKERS